MNWKPSIESSPVSLPSRLSPIRSASLANFSGRLRNRIPTQMRRAIPIYLICITILMVVFKASVVPVSLLNSPAHKRQSSRVPLDRVGQADFPKKIWQSWKLDPLNFEKRDFDTARTWTTKNPGYRYEVLTDNNDLVYVEEMFGPHGFNRPDIIDFYRSVNAAIIKADLLRYMVMYAEGGVYADIDVEALKPIDRFIPVRYNPADIDMVVGVEIDQPQFRDHPVLGVKSMSFCQWTFMCRPQLPVMMQLIENIMAWLSSIAAKQNVPISEVVLDFDQVITGTGPSAFTTAVLDKMNQGSDRGEKITWDTFHAMDESKVVGRVLVLDVEKFAAGQGHSDSGNHNARGVLVKHHYHASNWPSKHPRFKHPAYGEVEQCNWDPVCVKQWDENVEAYKNLPAEEQNKILEAHEHARNLEMEEAAKKQEKELELERFLQAVKKQEDEARARAQEAGRQANSQAQPESDGSESESLPRSPPPPPPSQRLPGTLSQGEFPLPPAQAPQVIPPP